MFQSNQQLARSSHHGIAKKPKRAVGSSAGLANHSSGAPLPISTRRKFESSFGHDFADVRVHTDEKAGSSAAGLSANAYSVGSDIVFSEGRYQPGSIDGDRLLAHELTHVVQQDQFGPGDPTRVSDHYDRSEEEARAVARTAVSGEAVQVEAMPYAGLSRDDDPPTVSPFKSGPLAPVNMGLLNGSPPGINLGYGAPLSPIIPDAPNPFMQVPPDPTAAGGGGGGGGDTGKVPPWGVGIQGQYGPDQKSIAAGLTVHF